MHLEEQNILFFSRTMGIGGTENVILQLCDIFKDRVNKIVVCSSGGVHEKNLNDNGIKHYVIPDISSHNPIKVIKTFLAIKQIIKTEKITVIHSHHRMAAFYSELIADKSICKIATAHNTFKNKKILTHLSYKDTYLIAVGEMVKRNLVDFYNIHSSQVAVIHNAIRHFNGNIQVIDQLRRMREEGNILIGNIGRLSEQKGMYYYILSAEMTLSKHDNVRFFIVGDGELKDELVSLVRLKGLENRVFFLGYRNDIQNVMSQLDFVVLSSLWEGFPLTPIEAFSVGKTVIGTAVDGTPEIIKDCKNGLLVPPKDVKALSEKMNLLIENPSLKRKLELAAMKCYEEEFSFEKLSGKYINYYESL